MQLNPTRLGTKSHWDAVYEEEKDNFEEFGDEGEIWFGQDSVDKMVNWTLSTLPPNNASNLRILDIGTGNGVLPISLAEAGYNPEVHTICGIDYSEGAIELAQQVAAAHNIPVSVPNKGQARQEQGSKQETGTRGIHFYCEDFIYGDENSSKWHLLLDKGTFDAVALMQASEDNTRSQTPTDMYSRRVEARLEPGGYFLITSCNFTEEELKKHFLEQAPSLSYHSRIQHPTYAFGGKSGSVCCTVAFQKRVDGQDQAE